MVEVALEFSRWPWALEDNMPGRCSSVPVGGRCVADPTARASRTQQAEGRLGPLKPG